MRVLLQTYIDVVVKEARARNQNECTSANGEEKKHNVIDRSYTQHDVQPSESIVYYTKTHSVI